MYVFATQNGVFGNGAAFAPFGVQYTQESSAEISVNDVNRYAAGSLLEIPREYYNEQTMTRCGPPTTPAQWGALIPWKTFHPDWPFPINGE